MDVEEQERKLIRLALRVAGTYCRLAETHTYFLHRSYVQRVTEKAKDEIAIVERRLDKRKDLFGTDRDSVSIELSGLKKRIQLLEEWAAV